MTQQQDVRGQMPECVLGEPVCRERWCHTAVAEQGGRWFITMGHPGFNSRANNGRGYATRETARNASARYGVRMTVPCDRALYGDPCAHCECQGHPGLGQETEYCDGSCRRVIAR